MPRWYQNTARGSRAGGLKGWDPNAPPGYRAAMPEPVLLHSALLRDIGVPHAFTTRIGGASAGIFASLNFGNPGDMPPEQRDPASTIRRNFELVLAAMGRPEARLVQVHQVHGPEVAVADQQTWPGPPAAPIRPDPKADAVITRDPQLVLAVRIADCAPILLSTPEGGAVGAVHAGWRGVISGVLPRAIERLADLGGVPASSITAAIGPCIGPGAFEVGPEVVEQFDAAFPDEPGVIARRTPDGKGFVDLQLALVVQARRAGLVRIERLARCTASEPEWFFSHRRDAGRTGRMAALIAARPARS